MMHNIVKLADKIAHKIKYKVYGIDVRGKVPYKKTQFIVKGNYNTITVIKNDRKININSFNYKKYLSGIQLLVKGNNNIITIHLPAKFIESKIVASGDCNEIELKKTKYKYDSCVIRAMRGAKIFIDEDFSDACDFDVCISGKDTSLSIGKDCMFSARIRIINNDGHQILDQEGIVLNKLHSIKIGNHVWVGMDVMFLKNAEIPDNIVIGARSLVNKPLSLPKDRKLSNGIIIAGVPAKIIKENIQWRRDGLK